MIDDKSKKTTSDDLKVIVQKFNDQFKEWMDKTGCRANFGWQYPEHDSIKTMEIQSIDLIVYRKPPLDFGEPKVGKMDRTV